MEQICSHNITLPSLFVTFVPARLPACLPPQLTPHLCSSKEHLVFVPVAVPGKQERRQAVRQAGTKVTDKHDRDMQGTVSLCVHA
jgi:hypothetical protein